MVVTRGLTTAPTRLLAEPCVSKSGLIQEVALSVTQVRVDGSPVATCVEEATKDVMVGAVWKSLVTVTDLDTDRFWPL